MDLKLPERNKSMGYEVRFPDYFLKLPTVYPTKFGITVRCRDSRVSIPTSRLPRSMTEGVLYGEIEGTDIRISGFGPPGSEGTDVIGRFCYHPDGNIFLTEEEISRSVYDGIKRSLKNFGEDAQPFLPVEMVVVPGKPPEVGIYQISLDLTHAQFENPRTRRCLEIGFCRKEVEELPILTEIQSTSTEARVDVVIPDVIEFV